MLISQASVLLAVEPGLAVLVTVCISHLFHPSHRLHSSLNLVLPLRNLYIPLFILLKVIFSPSNNLLDRRILFQKVKFRDSGLDGLVMFLVQFGFFYSRGRICRETRRSCVNSSSIYSLNKALRRTKRRFESKKLFPDLFHSSIIISQTSLNHTQNKHSHCPRQF